jgi:ribosomal protein S16
MSMFQEEGNLCSTKMDRKRVIEWRGNGAIHKEKVRAFIEF